MDNWLNYLSINPVIALALVFVLVLFLFMVFRKLIKWAVISFAILAVAIGLSYNEAQQSELIKRGEKILKDSGNILKDSEKSADKVIKKLRKDIKKKSK